jgi:hypothetical protein
MEDYLNHLKIDFDSSVRELELCIQLICSMCTESAENCNFELFENSIDAYQSFHRLFISHSIKTIETIVEEAKLYLKDDEKVHFVNYCERKLDAFIGLSTSIECTRVNQSVVIEKIFWRKMQLGVYWMPTMKVGTLDTIKESNFASDLIDGVRKYIVDWKEQIISLRLENVKVKKRYTKAIHSFESFLCCSEDKKKNLMAKLVNLFETATPGDAVKILFALEKKGFLMIPTRGKQEMYNSINETFNKSYSNQNFQYYFKQKREGVSYDKDINKLCEILSDA